MTVIDWIVTRKCNLNCYYCLQGTDTRRLPCPPVDTTFLVLAEPGKYSFHLTGGEPLLVPGIGGICARIVESSNLLSLNTNLTVNPLCITESVGPDDVAFINASVHFPYRSKSMANYVKHYNQLRDNGYFVVGSCVMIPESFDEIVTFIDNARNKYGITIFPKLMRGISGMKSYPQSYSVKQLAEIQRLTRTAAEEAEKFSPRGLNSLAAYSPSIDSWNGGSIAPMPAAYCFDGIQAIHLDSNGDWIKCNNVCIGNVYSDGFKPLSEITPCGYSVNNGCKKYCTRQS